MHRLLPRLVSEPPPEYIDFVGRHLASLRHDAAQVVGADRHADELYPDVLTDVAVRWRWLELLRTRLGRPTAGEAYLERAFAHRSQRWHTADVRVEEDVHEVRFTVWDPQTVEFLPPPPPVRSSVALRLAPQLGRPAGMGGNFSPVAEAAIAWWHAYQAHRRRRLIAVAVLGFIVALVIVRFGGPEDAAAIVFVNSWYRQVTLS